MHNNPYSAIFLGTPDLAARILQALFNSNTVRIKSVVTQEDKASGRGNKIHYPPVKVFAQTAGIPVLQPHRIRKELPQFMESLRALGPIDFGIVAAFGQILPDELLDYPRFGCINVHASLLPRWRGAAPIQRALMEGDAETGVCIMHVTEGLDEGPVYSQESTPIDADDDFQSLHDRLSDIGARLLIDALHGIAAGTLSAQPQKEDGATYAAKLSKEEEIIDWQKDSVRIWQQIRALAPSPGAFTSVRGKRLKILKAALLDQESPSVQNDIGGISLVDKNALHILCGKGALSVLEVQPEGKRRMPIKDFLAGVSLRLGQKME